MSETEFVTSDPFAGIAPALASAVVKARKKMGIASRDATNPHLKTNYATLNSLLDEALVPLLDEGVLLSLPLVSKDGYAGARVQLVHQEGYIFCSPPFYVKCPKEDPQGYGSASKYAQRYVLAAFFGIQQQDPDDDDGHGAIATTQSTTRKPDVQMADEKQRDRVRSRRKALNMEEIDLSKLTYDGYLTMMESLDAEKTKREQQNV